MEVPQSLVPKYCTVNLFVHCCLLFVRGIKGKIFAFHLNIEPFLQTTPYKPFLESEEHSRFWLILGTYKTPEINFNFNFNCVTFNCHSFTAFYFNICSIYNVDFSENSFIKLMSLVAPIHTSEGQKISYLSKKDKKISYLKRFKKRKSLTLKNL